MSELEERWQDLGEFIREQRRVGQLSLRKLSEMAGISNPYLSQIERGLRKPSAEILQQIARALEISAETLYVQAGILEPRDDAVDVIGEIRRDPAINEEQKKTLIHIYDSFRAEHHAALVAAGLDPDVLLAAVTDDEAVTTADAVVVADDEVAPTADAVVVTDEDAGREEDVAVVADVTPAERADDESAAPAVPADAGSDGPRDAPALDAVGSGRADR